MEVQQGIKKYVLPSIAVLGGDNLPTYSRNISFNTENFDEENGS